MSGTIDAATKSAAVDSKRVGPAILGSAILGQVIVVQALVVSPKETLHQAHASANHRLRNQPCGRIVAPPTLCGGPGPRWQSRSRQIEDDAGGAHASGRNHRGIGGTRLCGTLGIGALAGTGRLSRPA